MDLPAKDFAERFWAAARLPERYPRDIEHAVALLLPLTIVKLPTLTTTDVKQWLGRNRVAAQVAGEAASLMGCLVAHRGHGIVFVCGGDTPDEQRLTIAHETAHFLGHYLVPRERVLRAMGESIAPVLDGEREATPEERVAGVLAGVRVGAHVHLLERDGVTDERVTRAEDDADDLGLELVAPREAIIAYLRTRHVEQLGPTEQQRALASQFGVPGHAFARILAERNEVAPPSFVTDALSAIRRSQ